MFNLKINFKTLSIVVKKQRRKSLNYYRIRKQLKLLFLIVNLAKS